jgi:hypothetical protein
MRSYLLFRLIGILQQARRDKLPLLIYIPCAVVAMRLLSMEFRNVPLLSWSSLLSFAGFFFIVGGLIVLACEYHKKIEKMERFEFKVDFDD